MSQPAAIPVNGTPADDPTALDAWSEEVASVNELAGAEARVACRRRLRDGSTRITKNAKKAIRKTQEPCP
jgi:hypothetical protein